MPTRSHRCAYGLASRMVVCSVSGARVDDLMSRFALRRPARATLRVRRGTLFVYGPSNQYPTTPRGERKVVGILLTRHSDYAPFESRLCSTPEQFVPSEPARQTRARSFPEKSSHFHPGGTYDRSTGVEAGRSTGSVDSPISGRKPAVPPRVTRCWRRRSSCGATSSASPPSAAPFPPAASCSTTIGSRANTGRPRYRRCSATTTPW